MTNADKIRNMSDEQLAHLITDYSNDCCCGCVCVQDGRECHDGCKEAALKWLRETA